MTLHQELYDIWHSFYLSRKGYKYRWTARDERHLKNIRLAIEDQIINICKPEQVQRKEELIAATFKALLKNIADPWILSNLETGVIDMKFNQIWSKLNQRFPDYYDKDFEKHLERENGTDAVIKYHRHLISKGWVKLYGMGGQRWIKPEYN